MARIQLAECREFMRAAQEKALEMGVPVSIAIVSAEGHLIALERMDDAGFITPTRRAARPIPWPRSAP